MRSPLADRILFLSAESADAEDHAIREAIQELLLYGLSESGFFSSAAFHGGTLLRIVHGLERFSEDLDYSLDKAQPAFAWEHHVPTLRRIMESHGLDCEYRSPDDGTDAVRRLMVSTAGPDASLLRFSHRPGRKLRVRLEVDTNPPAGASTTIGYSDFPITHPLKCFDLPSGFAGKCHALLCRGHLKGRDFFDFSWYVGRSISPNMVLFASSIEEAGPWKSMGVEPDAAWLLDALRKRFETVDWNEVRRDVSPFLDERQRKTLDLWGADFFRDRLAKLAGIME